MSAPGSAFWDQSAYDVRCEWGPAGLAALDAISDVVIIVDVLSFSSCVDVAVARGAIVYPFAGEDAAGFARRVGGVLVGRASASLPFSVSALLAVEAGACLVLPSPNGSALSAAARAAVVLTGCLRNASAVAAAAAAHGRTIAVIPAGERWPAGGALRPAAEDLIGAGAIIAHLPGRLSPEAKLALAAFRAVADDLPAFLAACSSGREHAARGTAADVALAARLDASQAVPRLLNGAYRDAGGGEA